MTMKNEALLEAVMEGGELTLHIGIVEFVNGDKPQDLVRLADQAVCRAKNAGGHCISSHVTLS